MTADFILRVLHETSKSDQHAAQQMLALLQTIVPYWPPHVRYLTKYFKTCNPNAFVVEILHFMSDFTSTS